MEKVIFSLDEVESVVKNYIIPYLKDRRIFTFKGPLGAGKTTLIKELFAQVGVKDVVTSPTFAYVKHYSVEPMVFNHFDLYRLSSVDGFLDLGFDEYLYDEGSYSVIEWPGIIEELLGDDSVKSRVVSFVLDYIDDDLDRRILTIK